MEIYEMGDEASVVVGETGELRVDVGGRSVEGREEMSEEEGKDKTAIKEEDGRKGMQGITE